MALAKVINAADNALNVEVGAGRSDVIDGINKSVSQLLNEDVPDIVAVPQSTVTEPVTTVPEPDSAFKLPPNQTDEEAAILNQRQLDMDAETALQDRFNTRSVDMNRSDINKIWGDLAAPEIVKGLLRLGKTDSVMIPFDQAKKIKSIQSVMGVPQDVDVDADPNVIDTNNYVDKNKTVPLTQADMFSYLEALRLTSDSRTLEVLPDLQILAMAMTEAHIKSNMEQESLIPQELVDNFSKEDISNITGINESDIEGGATDQTLGKIIHQEWLKMKQREREGPDARLEDQMDTDLELTKEAYEQLALWAKQSYAVARPDLLVPVKVNTKSGRAKWEYLPTSHGIQEFEQSTVDLMPPKVYERPQLIRDAQATSQTKRPKPDTGNPVKVDQKKGEPKNNVREDEARFNFARVRHIVSSMRMKVGMILSIVGLGASADVKVVESQLDENGNAFGGKLIVSNSLVDARAADVIGIGQTAADKINNAAANALLQADSLLQELMELPENSPRADMMQTKIDSLISFASDAKMDDWKLRAYRLKSTQALQMLQDIAEFKDDAISFTNYLQRGTSRIGYSAQKMNMQNHKLARQMYGSEVQYLIVPGSNSNAEYAMLITWGAHFFSEGNTVPTKMYSNMQDRIKARDSKLMKIASAGRKIKAVLDNYNADTTTSAILAMNTVQNRISGVNNVISTANNLQFDEEVQLFLAEVFNHPNEAINLIEEAVELSRYMDSLASGKPFTSMMRPVEVDGISNGIASMATQLGIRDVMFRIGVLRQDPDKVLAEFKDIEGNIRKELANNMLNSTQTGLGALLTSTDFQKKYNVTHADFDDLKIMLDLAIKAEFGNGNNIYLKQPIMTLPYGQAVSSMLYIGLEAITQNKNPALKTMAESHRLGVTGVAKLLHGILAHNLEATLGMEVIEFSEALKGAADVAMLANEPIIFTKPSGSPASIGVVDFEVTGSDVISQQINQRGVDESGKEFSNPIRGMRTQYHPTRKVVNALGGQRISGSSMTTGILPQVIISIDGSVMSITFSGDSYKRIQKDSGQGVPYGVAIYDAIIGDLGSFRSLVNNINKTWVDTTLDYDLINALVKGTSDAQKKGTRKLTALADNNPNDTFEDTAQVRQMVSVFMKSDPDLLALELGKSAYDEAVKLIMVSSNKPLTNAEALTLYKSLQKSMNRKLERLNKVAMKASHARKALKKELNEDPVWQFSVDDISAFNYG